MVLVRHPDKKERLSALAIILQGKIFESSIANNLSNKETEPRRSEKSAIRSLKLETSAVSRLAESGAKID